MAMKNKNGQSYANLYKNSQNVITSLRSCSASIQHSPKPLLLGICRVLYLLLVLLGCYISSPRLSLEYGLWKVCLYRFSIGIIWRLRLSLIWRFDGKCSDYDKLLFFLAVKVVSILYPIDGFWFSVLASTVPVSPTYPRSIRQL